MIGHSQRCLVCGDLFYATGHQQLCSLDCRRRRANDQVRAWYWRTVRGQEPPPRSSRQQTCVICGAPLDQEVGVPITLCSPACRRERNRQFSAAHFAKYHKRQAVS
jgi:predicted nucleic acid-binding Zn ribbon protein